MTSQLSVQLWYDNDFVTIYGQIDDFGRRFNCQKLLTFMYFTLLLPSYIFLSFYKITLNGWFNSF